MPVRANGSATPAAQDDRPQEQEGKPAPSIQSPASALADLLSTLELATPAPTAKPAAAEAAEPAHTTNGEAPSKEEAAPVQAAERPEAARDGDVPVGLCYDPVMEQHVGPPSKAAHPLQNASLCQEGHACRRFHTLGTVLDGMHAHLLYFLGNVRGVADPVVNDARPCPDQAMWSARSAQRCWQSACGRQGWPPGAGRCPRGRYAALPCLASRPSALLQHHLLHAPPQPDARS